MRYVTHSHKFQDTYPITGPFTHGTIATAICLSQLVGCMRFSVIVTKTSCEYLHLILHNPFVANIICDRIV